MRGGNRKQKAPEEDVGSEALQSSVKVLRRGAGLKSYEYQESESTKIKL